MIFQPIGFQIKNKRLKQNMRNIPTGLKFIFRLTFIGMFLTLLSGCGVYTFKDVSIPADIKTIKLRLLEN